MTKLNRTRRRAAICCVEQLDDRIALSGMTAAVHSGPVPFPVSPIPPSLINISPTATVTDGVPVTTPINGTKWFVPIMRAGVATGTAVSTSAVASASTFAAPGHGFNPYPQLYPSNTPGHIHF
jgi:hypothetical protein